MLGHTTATFSIIESSISIEEDFFSVAMTMPFDAAENEGAIGGHYYTMIPLIPRLVVPCETAAKACSICTSFPLGEKTVRE